MIGTRSCEYVLTCPNVSVECRKGFRFIPTKALVGSNRERVGRKRSGVRSAKCDQGLSLIVGHLDSLAADGEPSA